MIMENKLIEEIIRGIRNCKLSCYTHRYKYNLNTKINNKIRTITVEELKNAKPLIDDWSGQHILFISQAPSKQAWVDGELSSLNNRFFSEILLPKIYPQEELTVALSKWRNSIFWVHTANCYPFVYTKDHNKNRDRLPDLRCANMYLDSIINTMKPKLIILMSGISTRFFANSIRRLIKSEKLYPSLEEILNWQRLNQSSLSVASKSLPAIEYKAVAIGHVVNPPSDDGIFARELVVKLIQEA